MSIYFHARNNEELFNLLTELHKVGAKWPDYFDVTPKQYVANSSIFCYILINEVGQLGGYSAINKTGATILYFPEDFDKIYDLIPFFKDKGRGKRPKSFKIKASIKFSCRPH